MMILMSWVISFCCRVGSVWCGWWWCLVVFWLLLAGLFFWSCFGFGGAVFSRLLGFGCCSLLVFELLLAGAVFAWLFLGVLCLRVGWGLLVVLCSRVFWALVAAGCWARLLVLAC